MKEQIKADFNNLVSSFYIAGWQQLGKMANALTGKLEKNLDQAKYSIDMLVMLRDKTKGNLNKEEENLINQTVANLQMNYVEELKEPATSTKEEVTDKKEEKS